MPTVHLNDRAIITVTGPEAETFLQNILTIDLATVAQGEARAGALLAPQGKILFDFLVSRASDGIRLECRPDVAADFARRLMLYRLRAKAEISVSDESLVAVSWENDPAGSSAESGVIDRRFADITVLRHYADAPAADAPAAGWTRLRIANGIGESGDDYALGDAFPHDVLLDQNGGVGFKKGCYIGQEVVSRMQHRSTARRRLLIAKAESALPAPGATITANGRAIGSLGSVVGTDALALLRIDKAKDAMDSGVPILAGEVPVTLAIPGWARFTFPEAAAESDA